MLWSGLRQRWVIRSVRSDSSCFIHEHPETHLALVQEGLDGLAASPSGGEPAREGHGLGRGTVTLEESAAAAEEELWVDDSDGDYAGWFCVRTSPFPCPAAGCSFVAEFMTAAHLILVWEEQDDPNLLRHAHRAQEVGRNPRVVCYESPFGPCASYYLWEAAGRPVHGVKHV